jgi:hypothetical protein
MSKLKDWVLSILGVFILVIVVSISTTFTCAYLMEDFNFNKINCTEDNYSAVITIGDKSTRITHVSELYSGIRTYRITDAATGDVHVVDKRNVDLIKNNEVE